MNEAKAAELLIHYFRTVYEKVGLQWDSDHDSEIRELIHLIFKAKGEHQ